MLAGSEFLAIGKLADSLAKLLARLRGEKDRRNKKAAAYFDSLGSTLEQMAVKLRRKEIPRVEGNRFERLVASFDAETKGLPKSEDIQQARDEVRKAAYIAQRLDWHYLVQDERVARMAERWLADIERTAGLLQAIGALLRPGA